MRLHFELALVQRLLAHAKNAREHRPTFDQMCDGRFRRDGKTLDFDGTSADFPTSDDVDPTTIPAGLWLVGDTGISLMSNGAPPLLPSGSTTSNVVAYAAECDPRNRGDWWDVKQAAFGGDDGTLFLEASFIEGLIARGRAQSVCLDATPERVEAVTPRVTAWRA
jgi:hypothetical protein